MLLTREKWKRKDLKVESKEEVLVGKPRIRMYVCIWEEVRYKCAVG